MEEEKTEMMTELSQELESLRREVGRLRTEACLSSAMMEAGVKNVGAVRGILEPYVSENTREDGSVEGLGERLSEISADRDTAPLFKESPSKYLGAAPGESGFELEGGEIDFEGQLKSARSSGDFIKAIRIKQEAAREGIILI